MGGRGPFWLLTLCVSYNHSNYFQKATTFFRQWSQLDLFLNTYMIAFCQMCWENRGRWRNGDDWGEDIGVGAIEAFEWQGDCQEWCFWLGMRQWKHHHFQKCKSSRARALHVPNCLYVWYAIWLFPFVFGMHLSFFLVFWNLGFLRFGKLCGFSEDLSCFLV